MQLYPESLFDPSVQGLQRRGTTLGNHGQHRDFTGVSRRDRPLDVFTHVRLETVDHEDLPCPRVLDPRGHGVRGHQVGFLGAVSHQDGLGLVGWGALTR